MDVDVGMRADAGGGGDSLLFTGLLINRDSVSPWFSWLHNFSFFHAAYEALTVNELRYLTLKEKRVSWQSSRSHCGDADTI